MGDDPQRPDWIAGHLESLPFVEWDRFVVGEMNGHQFIDVYGWIGRDDEYKDFIWSRFWPSNESIEFTTSSDTYSTQISEIWFGDSSNHNGCQRVEDTFDVENAVTLDE